MAQTVFSKTAVLDFYGQPGTVANPPANFARMYYNAGSNQLVCVDSNGNNLITGGGGGVSSFTGDGVLLSNSGSTGAITATTPNRTANTVYAGPATGAAAAGSFRALVAADIPAQTNWFMGDVPPSSLVPTPITPTAAAGSGTTGVYTVPANKRAFVWANLYNTTVGSLNYSSSLSKDGGSTFKQITNQAALGAGAASVAGASFLILEAGDIFAINTSGAGINIFPSAQLFSNTSRIKQAIFTAFASGDNIVYTCPGGKTAVFVQSTAGPYANTAPTLFMVNGTGGSVTYQAKLTPSGGSTLLLGASTAVVGAVTSVNSGLVTNGANIYLNAGDALVINSGSATAGQMFIGNVYEF